MREEIWEEGAVNERTRGLFSAGVRPPGKVLHALYPFAIRYSLYCSARDLNTLVRLLCPM